MKIKTIIDTLLMRDSTEPQYKATRQDKIYVAILVVLLILSTLTIK